MIGAVADIHGSAMNALGTRAMDSSGNEHIYLKGVASVVAGSCVTYDESFQTSLGAANAIGPVAFARAAVVANKYGWFMIFGTITNAVFGGAAVADAALYLAAGGAVDDAVVAGDCIVGAKVAATVGGAGAGAVQMSYPFATDKLG
jgi:hypothetical protein